MSKARELADVIGTQDTTENVLQGRRNLIINGAMQVAQRGTSVTGLRNSPDYLTDRWSYRRTGLWGSFEATMSNESTSLEGFPNSTKLQVTTAETNTAAACWLSQRIEGQNLQLLKYGSSSAEQVTFSFWVKSNLTGTFTAFLDSSGGSGQRSYRTYTINTADTWEYKTVTFSGDQTYTLPNTSGNGMSVNWMLSGVNSIATEDSWTGTAYGYVSGTTNDFSTSTSNYFEVTGVQLEVGSVATPFEHRSYGEELALCQRYYWKSFDEASGSPSGSVIATTGVQTQTTTGMVNGCVILPVQLRAVGTCTYYDYNGTVGKVTRYNPNSANNHNQVGYVVMREGGRWLFINSNSGAAASQVGVHVEVDAEL